MLSSRVTRPLTRVVRTPYPRLTAFGSTISARTADEDGRNLRGNSADRVIVDEAAYVRDSVIHEVISPMLADCNGQLVMVSTPFGKNHFYRAFARGQVAGVGCQVSGDGGEGGSGSTLNPQHSTCSFSFPSWSNPHISREYIEEQRSLLSPRQFAVEYEARFVDDQSAVFAWEEIEAAANSSGQWTVNSGESGWDTVVAGIDWARYPDYTALVALRVSESGCEVVDIDRFNGLGWNLQIERAVRFLAANRVTAVLTDQTSVGDPVTEQLKERLWKAGVDTTVDGYVFTNQSKRDLIEHLALRFAQGRIAIPRDEQLMRELQYFEYELTASGNVRMNARSGCHDDLVIALALACWQARSTGSGGAYLAANGRIAVRGW